MLKPEPKGLTKTQNEKIHTYRKQIITKLIKVSRSKQKHKNEWIECISKNPKKKGLRTNP